MAAGQQKRLNINSKAPLNLKAKIEGCPLAFELFESQMGLFRTADRYRPSALHRLGELQRLDR